MRKTEKNKILRAYKQKGKPMTSTEAGRSAKVNLNTARWAVQMLTKEARLVKIEGKRGLYKIRN